jgi:flagellar basal-body rod modification protein FlgD
MIVSNANQSSVGGTYTTSTGSAAAQDQFLRLLVTQIQNQNPLDPMSNEEFTSQLTQFSMLEQLENVNDNLMQGMAYNQSLNNTMMLDLVGRRATVLGDGVTVSDGVATPNRLRAAGNGTVTVEVRDEAGELVDTFTQDVEQGWNDLSWDGRTADDESAPDGDYTFSVTATDRAGEEIAAQLYMTGQVESIRFENNLAILTVAGREYYAAEIVEVGL